MPKLYLENGAVVEGSIDEIAELAKKLDGGEVTEGYRKITGRKPRVGDFIKFIEDDVDITVGKYYKIVEIDDDGDYRFYDDVVEKNWVSPGADNVEFYEKVNAAADEAVTADAEPEFKVGDYVKLSIPDGKSPAFGWGDVKNGDVGKVVSVWDFKIVVDFPKQKEWNAKPEELIKLTAREVSFAKAGRKLDEFKVGDIVRIIDSHAYVNGLKGYDGLITEIDDIDEMSLPFHVIKPSFVENDVNTWLHASQIELITPVENRVDR
ncbi:MAG: hypothetical protein IRZ03_18470 [Acidobacterium ailaaui]|nr:hypothetical protein [Pseudacidobacterium ailaaui]